MPKARVLSLEDLSAQGLFATKLCLGLCTMQAALWLAAVDACRSLVCALLLSKQLPAYTSNGVLVKCLQALSLNLPHLQQLRLAHVAGVSDEGIVALSCITSLLELTVLGPHNKALSQNSLAALAPIRGLRWVTYGSSYQFSHNTVLTHSLCFL